MAKFQEIESAVVSLDKQVKQLTTDLQSLINAVNSNSKSQTDLANKTNAVTKATGQISAVEKELENIRKRGLKVTKETITAKENLRKRTKDLTDQVRKEQGTFKKSGGLFRSMTKSILAAGAAYFSLRAAISVVKNIINKTAEFGRSISEVKAIANAGAESFNKLKRNALDLGATTEKTAIEVAKLQKEYAKLGFTTDEILDVTEATINLSIAAGSDLANSATTAGATIRGFGLSTKETTRVTDVMAKSFTSSALDLEKFKTGMAIAAPVANSFGKDIEFTTAQLSILSDAGLDASTSGTSLRNMFLELSKQGLTWEEGLDKINNSTNKNVTALSLFGKRGATAALILAENTEKANRLEQVYDNAAGSAKKMADIMADNLAGDTKKASSAVEGLVLNIGSKLEPTMRNVTQAFTRFITNINESIKPQEKIANLYNLQDKELTTLFGSLKNTNLSQDARNKLIQIANEKYGEYLPNLLTEKSTLDDIEKAEKAINKQLRLKVIQQAFQEEINDLLKAELQAKEALVENEIARDKAEQERFSNMEDITQAQKDQQKFLLDLGEDLAKSTIENNETEVSNVEDKFKRIGELYGIAFDEIEAVLKESTDVVEAENDKIIEDDKKKYKKLLENAKKFGVDLKAENTAQTQSYINSVSSFQEDIENEIENQLRLEQEAVENSMQAEVDARQKASQDAIDIEAKKAALIKQLKTDSEKAAQDIITGLYNARIDDNLSRFQEDQEAKEDLLKNRLDKGEISEEEYNKKVKALKLKSRQEEAKAEKKKALFEIAIATAVAAVKALPALPLVALVVALGAVQAAVVAARPIPKFKHGTNGELQLDTTAIVGDGAGDSRELVTTPQGSFISPSKDTLVHLPRGSQVFSHNSPETQAALNGGMTEEMYQGLINEQRLTRKAISSQPKSVTKLTDRGLERAYITKQRKINLLDEYIRS